MKQIATRMFAPSFRGYKRKHLKKDFIAALVVTAIAIPESLGFAAIVGLPIQTGLYCALLAPIVFALLTSSRHLVIGADSATAALVASGAATIAAAGSAQYPAAVAILGVVTGVLLLAMSVLRLGFLADLISKPVLVGFLAGVGVQLLVGKLPEMLGIDIHGGLIEKLGAVLTHASAIHWPTAAVAFGALAVVVVSRRYKLPGALLALVGSVIVTKLAQLEQYGIHTVGDVPAGLPGFVMPDVSLAHIAAIFSSALAIAVVILAQSLATIRTFADKYDESVAENRDLMALGFANIASALTHGFAVNGSPPRTSAGEVAGGRSQMVNVYMALLIGALLLFATDVLQYVPHAALAAIVCSIGLHLIKIDQLKDIWHAHKIEFGIAMVALVAVALLGVQQGIVIAVLCALIERLRREYHPADTILLRDQKISEWAADRIQGSHRHTSQPEGVLVYRFDSDIFFENASYFGRRIRQAIEEAKHPVKVVILDAGAMSDIDYTGASSLRRVAEQLAVDEIRFGLAHVSPGLRNALAMYGVAELIGSDNIYPSLREAVRSQPGVRRSTIDMVKRLRLPDRSYVVIGGGVLEALGLRETMDVDMVVNKSTYKQFQERGWKEYVHDDGKRILSHRGYKIMTSYMGRDVHRLLRHAFVKQGVYFMGVDDLIKSKEQFRRAKDLEDIALLREYQKRQSV